MLSGQNLVAGGVEVAVAPTRQEGRREQGQDAPVGRGGIRGHGEKGRCGPGPCTVKTEIWDAEVIVGGRLALRRG